MNEFFAELLMFALGVCFEVACQMIQEHGPAIIEWILDKFFS